MSICPECQKPPAEPGFCERCCLALQPAPAGRFVDMLEPSVRAPQNLAPEPGGGLDLTRIQWEPAPWTQRVLWPSLRRVAVAGLFVSLLGGGALTYRNHIRRQHRQAAERLLATASGHPTKDGALEALREAELSGDTDTLCQAHVQLASLCRSEQDFDGALLHYKSLVKLCPASSPYQAGLQNAQRELEGARRKQARQLIAKARGHLALRRYAASTHALSRANALLLQYHGSPQEVADCNYWMAVNSRALGLIDDARDQVAEALKTQPKHAQARRLSVELGPKPPPPSAFGLNYKQPVRPGGLPYPLVNQPEPPVVRYHPSPTYPGAFGTRPAPSSAPQGGSLPSGPSYPTYQPPRPTLPENSLSAPPSTSSKRR